MKREYPVRSQQTLETINHLLDKGITKMSVILRHSDRFYHKDARMEPFMGLTDPGKTYAFDLGMALPKHPLPKLFSSMFGRCIETAYLIDKGYSTKHNDPIPHNTVSEILAPFYIKDIEKALHMLMDQGSQRFIRNWFNNEIDESIMEDPGKTADILTTYMIDYLKNLGANEIGLCVSHDWNIFPIKEFKLGLAHEGAGNVGYLDGLVFFEDEGKPYITSFQTDPKPL